MNWILGAEMKGKQKCCCMLYIARFRYDMASSILLLIAEMRHCSMFIILLNLDLQINTCIISWFLLFISYYHRNV